MTRVVAVHLGEDWFLGVASFIGVIAEALTVDVRQRKCFAAAPVRLFRSFDDVAYESFFLAHHAVFNSQELKRSMYLIRSHAVS